MTRTLIAFVFTVLAVVAIAKPLTWDDPQPWCPPWEDSCCAGDCAK